MIFLERFAYSTMGTFGRLIMEGFGCFTVERPWLDNIPRESCIPEGAYRIAPRRFNRGGYDAFEILDVPGRSLILFHRGNTMNDVIGCVALGRSLGYVEGLWAVTHSRETFADFSRIMPREESSITIGFIRGGKLDATPT